MYCDDHSFVLTASVDPGQHPHQLGAVGPVTRELAEPLLGKVCAVRVAKVTRKDLGARGGRLEAARTGPGRTDPSSREAGVGYKT